MIVNYKFQKNMSDEGNDNSQTTVDNSLLPDGYKRTEIGVIPEDWQLEKLGNCLLANPDYGINAAAAAYSENLPVYIRITDITEDGKFSPDKLCSVDNLNSNNYFLEDGNIVFARTGASTGKTYLYNQKDGRLVFAGFLIRAKVNKNKLNPTFLKSYTETSNYWNWVKIMSMRSGQPGINGVEYASLPIPLPPLPEQEAIAETLSDVDALVTALDGLISKKRDIKQGAMQTLLTGERRLPGFRGDWETKKVGEFADAMSGGTPNTQVSEYWNGNIRWMSSGELNLKFVYDVVGRITKLGLKNSSTKIIPPRCILIGLAGQGRTRGTVAMNMVELCTNQSIAAIYPSKSYNSDYLYYNLDNRYEELRSLSTGDGGRGGLNLKIIKSLNIPFPQIEEQKAIAEVLSEMDAEIEALERERDKYKALKQGMMQELLTGKRRLVKPQTAIDGEPAKAARVETLGEMTAQAQELKMGIDESSQVLVRKNL